MSLMWMLAQTTTPPLTTALSASGISAPTGAKISAASSGSRESVHLPTLGDRNLRKNVRRRAETVEAKPLRVAGEAQCAIADKAGAQKRCGVRIVVTLRHTQTEPPVGHQVFRIAAVQVVAGEARLVAEVFAVAAAIPTFATGPAEPRHAETFAGFEFGHAGAERRHTAHHLVPRYHRQLAAGELSVMNVQVSAAHAAGGHLEQHFPGSGFRHGYLPRRERSAATFQHHGHHVHAFAYTLLIGRQILRRITGCKDTSSERGDSMLRHSLHSSPKETTP